MVDRRRIDYDVAVERRKRGRRSLVPGQSTTRLILSLPEGMYDRLYQAARLADISIPEAIRRVLAQQLRNNNSATQ